MAGKKIDVTIGLVDKLSKPLQGIEGVLARSATRFKNAGQQIQAVGGAIAGVGSSLTAAVTMPIVGAGTAAVKIASDFETAMSQVSATMLLDKTIEKDVQSYKILEDAALKCGRTTVFSAEEAAEALNYLALAGYSPQKAAEALPTVLDLASAGAMELADASDMLTDAMSALNIEASKENLNIFADSLAKAASKSNMSVQQAGEGILAVGATASGLKDPVNEVTTALGILADVGYKSAEGGTHVRNMILNLQNARSSSAAAYFKELGINAYDSSGKMRNMGEIFSDLSASMRGMADQKKDAIFSSIFKVTDIAAAKSMVAATSNNVEDLVYALKDVQSEGGQAFDSLNVSAADLVTMFGVSASQEEFVKSLTDIGFTAEAATYAYSGLEKAVNGFDGGATSRWEELSKMIEDSAGSCSLMAGIQRDNLNGQMELLRSGVDGVAIAFGSRMLPYIKQGIDFLNVLVEKISGLSDEQIDQIVKWAAIAAAVGPALLIFGKMVTLVGTVVSAIGTLGSAIGAAGGIFALLTSPGAIVVGILAAIAAASVWVYQNWDLVKSKAMEVWEYISGLLIKNGLTFDHIVAKMQPIMQVFGQIKEHAIQLGVTLTPLFNAIKTYLTEYISASIETAIRTFKKLFDHVSNYVKDMLTAFDGLIQFINGVFTGDWSAAWEGIKTVFTSVWDAIKETFEGVLDILTGGLELITNKITAAAKGISTLFNAGSADGGGATTAGHNATGTNYWKGGLTWVHENGAELIDLPTGTRVIPHDKSLQEAYRTGASESGGGVAISIPKLADQIVIREDSDIERIADALVRRLSKVSVNMA